MTGFGVSVEGSDWGKNPVVAHTGTARDTMVGGGWQSAAISLVAVCHANKSRLTVLKTNGRSTRSSFAPLRINFAKQQYTSKP